VQCRVPDFGQAPVNGSEYGWREYGRGGKLVEGVVGIFHRVKIGGCQQILVGMCTCRVCCVEEWREVGSGEM